MNRLVLLIAAALLLRTLDSPARAERIFGLTNFQELVTFDSGSRAVTRTVALPGFSIIGERLLSIDVRPAPASCTA